MATVEKVNSTYSLESKMLKTCTRCKITKNISEFGKLSRNKDGLRPACKECESKTYSHYCKHNKKKLAAKDKRYQDNNKDKRKEYLKKNKDKISEKRKEYKKKNKDKITKLNKEYRESNKEKIAKQGKEYRDKNKERLKEYYEQNKEKRLKQVKEYSKTPKGKMVAINSANKRRFRKIYTSDGTIPFSITYPLTHELQTLLTLQKNKCYLCNCILEKKHLDHYVPLSKGGTHSIDNVVWLCPTCNLSKSAKVPSELLLI